ncbi:hypothetical protein ACFVAD_15370 [Sutcliffiella sp. NPDC057660]|uniref:hypothetical protein n=1 Tax=Sutcliffiella sp. NPDC057660 TaxID=3346199 RepID=UPI00367B74E4
MKLNGSACSITWSFLSYVSDFFAANVENVISINYCNNATVFIDATKDSVNVTIISCSYNSNIMSDESV